MRVEMLLLLFFLCFHITANAQLSSKSHSSIEDNMLLETAAIDYNIPEAVGIDGEKLSRRIDSIVDEAIQEQAAPGAVVMVVKDNHIIFDKAYGYHTYENQTPTKVDDIFDLASISKIAATTLAVMNLKDNGKINLNETVGYYLKEARHTDKADLKLRDVMLHQAGLISYIPFHRALKPSDHSSDSSAAYPTKVADGYYLRKNYFNEVMWPEMLNSPTKDTGNYVYSDLSMYIMQKVVEQQSNMSLDDYVKQHFYDKLGMNTTLYNPWKIFSTQRIIPTERDKGFRDTLLTGFVHDQGAAMASGVAGHAGLFSTAGDLAIYGQLLLNRGTYDGVTLLKPETVDLFTSNQAKGSRRGLGFDRFEPDRTKEYPSRLATPSTFGHTGYTGTCIWIDPEHRLVYIFLSNRVHPKVSNKLSSLNIRSRIMDAIYEGIEEGIVLN